MHAALRVHVRVRAHAHRHPFQDPLLRFCNLLHPKPSSPEYFFVFYVICCTYDLSFLSWYFLAAQANSRCMDFEA